MNTPDQTLAVVRDSAEKRLQQMGYPVISLDAAQLEAHFGRASNGGIHFQVALDGVDCAYSIWLLTDPQQQQPIDAEMDRLRASQRVVSGGSVTISDKANLLTELLATRLNVGGATLRTMDKFIDSFWNHDSMRAVNFALSPEQGSPNP